MPPKIAPKKKNGYKLPDPLPSGEVLQDIRKRQWTLGSSIGKGGFGEIYSAKKAESAETKYPYVIKIEPHANGPLYVEMQFYMRNAKLEDISKFKTEKGLKTFGMPQYLGAGSHDHQGEKYRFVVMEKFGSDIWKLFLENKRSFPAASVFKMAVQILDVLEYIHQNGYVHADIKGSNILMGLTKETENQQVYLVDFGLATKYSTAKDYKPNPKKAHDGTIEYLSRDAHEGVQTRRGDLEILAYNLLQWLGCTLPWEKKITNPNEVHASKKEHMQTVQNILKACFLINNPPEAMVKFLTYLLELKFDAKPDYKRIRNIFIAGITTAGGTLQDPLQLSAATSKMKRKSSIKLLALPDKKRKLVAKKDTVITTTTKPKTSGEGFKRVLRPRKPTVEAQEQPKENVTKKKVGATKTKPTQPTESTTGILLQNGVSTNVTIRKRRIKSTKSQKSDLEPQKASVLNEDGMEGWTASMKEVKLKKMAKTAAGTKKKQKVKKAANKKTDVEPVASTSSGKTVKKPSARRRVADSHSESD